MSEELQNINIMGSLIHGVISSKHEFNSLVEASVFYDIAYEYCSKLMTLKWQKEEEWHTHHLSRQEQA